jgi:hypothetical protein
VRRDDLLQPPRRTLHAAVSRDGERRRLRIATTECGFRWDVHDHNCPYERESPTTSFGREFARACREIVAPFSERTGRTFMHGGCAMLADAVTIWSEGRLHPVGVRYYDQVDHVVSSDGRSFLDCDGRFDRKGFSRKSFVLDGDMNVVIERTPWDPADTVIARNADVSAWIADELRSRLRSPATEPWRLRA